MQGVALADILRGKGEPPCRAYRFTQTNGNELDGLKQDPGETCNLAGDPRYAPVIREWYRELWRFARESGDTIANLYIMTSLRRATRFREEGGLQGPPFCCGEAAQGKMIPVKIDRKFQR